MDETDEWDTEVAYNKLNYLIAPDTSAPSSVNHDTSDNQVNHIPELDRPDHKTWNRQVLIVLRPIVVTVAVMNHVVYMMADGGGEMLVRAI